MIKLTSIKIQSNLDAIPLSNQAKFRLNEINKIKYYFNSEIQERMIMSKKLSKHNYIGKTLIALSATSGRISIISFTSVIRVPGGLASASFTLIFLSTIEIIKKQLKVTRKKKNAIKLLCLLKAN